MTAVVDYGVGNLFSLQCSLRAVGEESVVTGDSAAILQADRVVLPGVGAFRDAREKLHRAGLDDTLRRAAERGVPLMGICLGMQLLFDVSHEFGVTSGLGLIKGEVRPLTERVPEGLKVPHMGWNDLDIVRPAHPLLKYVHPGDCVYFVHSYAAVGCDEALLARAFYGTDVTAAVAAGNVTGCQFHPEKSGPVGLNILKAFLEM